MKNEITSIYKYENGLSEPDLKMLMNFADYFYTSVDYLIGYVDEETLQSVEPLTNSELQHIKMYRRLSKALQGNFNAIIEDIVSTDKDVYINGTKAENPTSNS